MALLDAHRLRHHRLCHPRRTQRPADRQLHPARRGPPVPRQRPGRQQRRLHLQRLGGAAHGHARAACPGHQHAHAHQPPHHRHRPWRVVWRPRQRRRRGHLPPDRARRPGGAARYPERHAGPQRPGPADDPGRARLRRHAGLLQHPRRPRRRAVPAACACGWRVLYRRAQLYRRRPLHPHRQLRDGANPHAPTLAHALQRPERARAQRQPRRRQPLGPGPGAYARPTAQRGRSGPLCLDGRCAGHLYPDVERRASRHRGRPVHLP